MLQSPDFGSGATQILVRLFWRVLSLGSTSGDWLLCFHLCWRGQRNIPVGPVATNQAVCLPMPAQLRFSKPSVEDMVVTRGRGRNGSHCCCKENQNSSVTSAVQSPARISLSHVSPNCWLKTFNLLDIQNTALAHHLYESLEKGHWLQKQFLEPTAAAHEEVSSPFPGKTVEPESHCNHEPLHLSLPQQRKHFLQPLTSEALMEMSFKFWQKLI